jgi:hypothetical protein
VPLLCGEAARLAKRRRLDLPIYCAGAAGLAALLLFMPSASATGGAVQYLKQSATFWAKPRLRDMLSYGHMVCLWLPPFFAAIWGLTYAKSRHEARPSVPAHELAAAAGLALLVPVMIGVTWIATGYIVGRYAICAAMGTAMLIGFSAPLADRSVSALCTVALAAFLLRPWPTVGLLAPNRMVEASGTETIVEANALLYLPDWYYGSPGLRGRLHYLADLPFAVRQPDFLPELTLVALSRYTPPKPDDYRQFLSTHRRFLLYCNGSPNLKWVADRLRSEGWALKVVRSSGARKLYQVQAP